MKWALVQALQHGCGLARSNRTGRRANRSSSAAYLAGASAQGGLNRNRDKGAAPRDARFGSLREFAEVITTRTSRSAPKKAIGYGAGQPAQGPTWPGLSWTPKNIKSPMTRDQLEASVCALLKITSEQLRGIRAAGPTLRALSEAGSKP